MIELKKMSWGAYKKFQEEVAEHKDDMKTNGELIIKYSSSLSMEEIQDLPFDEVPDLIAEAVRVNGFNEEDAEKNLESSPTSSEPCTLPTDSEKQSES